jgi:hypothetical protein
MKRALLSMLCASLPACLGNVVPLQPQAQHVTIVHETDKPLHCEVLGKISGTSRSSDEKEARTGAENDFRNQAADLKANFALIEAQRGGQVGTGSLHDSYIGGKALLCETEEMEEAKEKAAAAAREQKDKEEAERQQKAADEKQEKAKEKQKSKT